MKKYDEIATLLLNDRRRLDESNLGVLDEPLQRAHRAVGALVDECARLR